MVLHKISKWKDMDLMSGLFDGGSGCRTEFRVVASGSMSGWILVLSGVPQELVLRLIFFIIFISDTDSEVECTLSKFADDTQYCGMQSTHQKDEIPFRPRQA